MMDGSELLNIKADETQSPNQDPQRDQVGPFKRRRRGGEEHGEQRRGAPAAGRQQFHGACQRLQPDRAGAADIAARQPDLQLRPQRLERREAEGEHQGGRPGGAAGHLRQSGA